MLTTTTAVAKPLQGHLRTLLFVLKKRREAENEGQKTSRRQLPGLLLLPSSTISSDLQLKLGSKQEVRPGLRNDRI